MRKDNCFLRLGKVGVLAGLVAALVVYGGSLHADDEPPVVEKVERFQRVDANDGLLNDLIFDAATDRYGFMWLATEEGVYRWDGVEMRPYLFSPTDPTSMHVGAAYDVAVSADGSVWISGPTVSRYDPATDSFRRYDERSNGVEIADDGTVYLADGSPDGGILKRFNPERDRFETIGEFPTDDSQARIYPLGQYGDKMIFSGQHYLYSFHPGQGVRQLKGSYDELDYTWDTETLIDGVVWRNPLGEPRLARYDIESERELESIQLPIGPDTRPTGVVKVPDGSIWIGTTNAGLLRWDGSAFEHFSPAGESQAFDSRVSPMAVDLSGGLWISVRNIGAFVYRPRIGTVSVLRNEGPRALTNSTVTSLSVDSQHRIWVGHARGVDIVEPSGAVTRIGQGTVDGLSKLVSAGGNVIATAEDATGVEWISVWGGGLHRRNPETGTVTDVPGIKGSIRAGSLLSHSSGDMWVGTLRNGLVRVDPETLDSQVVVSATELPQSSINFGVMAEDHNGVIWAGLKQGGLIEVDPSTNEFRRHEPSGETLDAVRGLAIDGSNRVWVSMPTGVATYDRATASWDHKPFVVDGQELSVKSIIPYGEHLWFGTNRGLHRWQPNTGDIRSIYPSNGAQGLTYSEAAFAADGDMLYFGGADGLNIIDATQPLPLPTEIHTRLTEIIVGRDSLATGSSLDAAPPYATHLTVPAKQSAFSFEFVAPDASVLEEITYRYRLVGLDTKWTTTDSANRRVDYTNIDPGDYQFEVAAREDGGAWGPSHVVAVAVEYHWYETRWARWGAAVVLAILLAGIAVVRTLRVRHRLAERVEHADDLEEMNRRVRHHAAQLETLMEAVPGGLALVDIDGRVITARYSDPHIPHPLPELAVGKIFKGAGGLSFDHLRRLDHRWITLTIGDRSVELWVATVNHASNQCVLVYHDVTDEVAMRGRAETQSRLASLGQFAAGIAHDLNNILAVISMSTELIEQNDDPNFTARIIDEVRRQVADAGDMIRQVLEFSSSSAVPMRSIQIGPVLDDLIDRGQVVVGSGTPIDLRYCDETAAVALVTIDRVRIQQLLFNLFTNARDAMDGQGPILVSVSTTTLADVPAGGLGTTEATDPDTPMLRITVADEGSGIPDEELATIFEPFQTSKPPGNGVGLGLSQVYGIVLAHGGLLSVDTQVGVGTEFHIFLPQTEASAAEASITSPIDASAPMSATVHHRVLVVDDNASLLSLVEIALEQIGFVVETCGSAVDALERWRLRRHDVIVTDILMPGMSGLDLIRQCRQEQSDQPAVVITGNPNLTDLSGGSTDENDMADIAVLLKPIRQPVLVEAILNSLSAKMSRT